MGILLLCVVNLLIVNKQSTCLVYLLETVNITLCLIVLTPLIYIPKSLLTV